MEAEFVQENILKLIDDLNKKYDDLKNATVNIAISGQSGAGKSSIINSIIGQKVAKVGSNETTREISTFTHNGLNLSDLPGCGTSNFPKESYIKNCNIESFDAFIITTSNRFYENDLWLISEIVKLGRPVYVVRTKMDEAVVNEKRENNLTETEVYNNARNEIKTNLKDIIVKGVYLISSIQPIREDFELLLNDIQNNLNGIKKDRFIADVTPYNKEILEKKKILARKIVSNRAYLAALNGINPIPGLDISLDIALLINMAKEIQSLYGLNEESLDSIAKKSGQNTSITALKIKVAQFASRFIVKEGVMILLKRLSLTIGAKEFLKYVPFVGQAISAGIGYKMTDSFGCELIEEADALADEILKHTTNSFAQNFN